MDNFIDEFKNLLTNNQLELTDEYHPDNNYYSNCLEYTNYLYIKESMDNINLYKKTQLESQETDDCYDGNTNDIPMCKPQETDNCYDGNTNDIPMCKPQETDNCYDGNTNDIPMCKQQETNNNKIKKKLYKKSKNSLSNLSKKFKQERDNMDLLSLYNNHY